MNIVVDTSVWSLLLRRDHPRLDDPAVRALRAALEADTGVFLVGPILQELLDGVRAEKDFQRLVKLLQSFPLLEVSRQTYVEAAKLSNLCRRSGVQAGGTDFLIAAACIEHGFPLLTTDRDFQRIAQHSGLRLVTV